MKNYIITIMTAFMIAAAVQATDASACTFGCTPPPAACTPTSFTAELDEVDAGDGTVLHWDSTGCVYASITPAAYPNQRPPSGSVSTGAIFHTTVFTLTVYADINETIIGGQRTLTVRVNDDGDDDDDNDSNCRIDEFDADDTSIQEGDSTDLNWETSGCDEVRINQGIGEVNLDGSEEVDPNDTTTYTLSAYEDGHLEDTDTVKITVSDDDDDDDSCSIDNFKADDYSIEEGDSTTIRWSTTGAEDVDLSPGYGNRSDDGSVNVSPSRTTTYTLEVQCDRGGDKSRSITISVDEENSSRPQAVTTVATILSSTSAQLNGLAIPNTNTGTTRAWFEWGPSGSLGYRTNSQSVSSNGGSTNYSAVVNGLVPGTAYFYRAVVENQNGTAYGDIVRFQTRTTTTTTNIVRTQVVRDVVVAQSAASLLELRVESTYDRMCVSGEIDYTVTYRNISTQTLQEAVLQINHQKEVTFISSSRGDYDVVDRTVTVELGSLAPGETGTILVHGRVNDLAVRGNLTVMTAQVVYTNPATRAQENAIAYSLVTISDDCPNVLGASAFGFGSFLPDTLLEWLLLILVILALIVLGRQMYKKQQQPAA